MLHAAIPQMQQPEARHDTRMIVVKGAVRQVKLKPKQPKSVVNRFGVQSDGEESRMSRMSRAPVMSS
ncbi:hypothetical protein ACSS6W_003951 [Trichoderma asperelloides]